MGTLFVISTPIGNLEDITLRALKKLFSVNIIACEDTRRTGALLDKLLNQFAEPGEDKGRPQLISYYEQNELERIPDILQILQDGQDVGLVSDAGTPLLSDPGFKLVRECVRQKINVEAIPGVSSPIAALSVSGLPTDKFLFVGYPPRKPGHRMTFYENIKKSLEFVNSTVILFEAPHKLVRTLKEMQEVYGDIEMVFARELTKIHEEVKHETISKALERYSKKKEPRGEFVLLFHL